MNDPRVTAGGIQAAFLAFIAEGELRYPIDPASGCVLSYAERSIGLRREAPVEWLPACGKAFLYSFTIYHQSYGDKFEVPYNVAWVELEEGPRLVSTVIAGNLAELRIGMPLAAVFEPSGRLVFHPSSK